MKPRHFDLVVFSAYRRTSRKAGPHLDGDPSVTLHYLGYLSPKGTSASTEIPHVYSDALASIQKEDTQ